jgi:hypothetical protein
MSDFNRVDEEFVNELLKSGVWDIARVSRGSRTDAEVISEDEEKGYGKDAPPGSKEAKRMAERKKKDDGESKGDKGKDKDDPEAKDYEDEGDRKGDEGAGKDDDDTDYSGKGMRKGDKSDTKPGKLDFMKKQAKKKEMKESLSAKDLAEELLDNLSEDVIIEFIDLLYNSVLNEEEEVEAEEEDSE